MAVTRLTFVGALQLEGALHIGSGAGGRVGAYDSLTDAAIVRDSLERPYIPGSSLRGVLRATVGQYAPLLFGNAGTAIGEIRDDRDIDLAVRRAREARNQTNDLSEQEIQTMLDATLHSAERLFGTTHWASPLLLPDLHLRDGQERRSEIRHGVGIDRDTGAARDGVKYDFEVLPRETVFDFWMRCDIPDAPSHYVQEWSILLAIVLRLLEQGELTLGGRAARGIGQARLTDLKVYQLTMSGSALLNALLAQPTQAARYGTELPEWIDRQLKEMGNVRQTPQ